MINTGHGVKSDHGAAEDAPADQTEGIALSYSLHNAKQGDNDSQTTTYNVSDHVHDFFAFGINGKLSLR